MPVLGARVLPGTGCVKIDGGKWFAPEYTGSYLPAQKNVRKYGLKVIVQHDPGQGLGGITCLTDDGAVLGITA